MFNFAPHSRDTLSREFWIGEGIAHAKVAKGGLGIRGLRGSVLIFVLFRLERN